MEEMTTSEATQAGCMRPSNVWAARQPFGVPREGYASREEAPYDGGGGGGSSGEESEVTAAPLCGCARRSGKRGRPASERRRREGDMKKLLLVLAGTVLVALLTVPSAAPDTGSGTDGIVLTPDPLAPAPAAPMNAQCNGTLPPFGTYHDV